MAKKRVILITGAGGEVGHGLIEHLHTTSNSLSVAALDVRDLDENLKSKTAQSITGDILDDKLLKKLDAEYELDTIYHLAALLSTSAERTPELAHRVNTQGTINLLELATQQARQRRRPVKFIFASSIAVYGVPDAKTKAALPPLPEDDYLFPITMYGCSKLYCEHLGRYYTRHFGQLAEKRDECGVDFRCVRFPGLISAVTVPSGGTSDYGPEMLHAAAKGVPYVSFVRPDTTMPFMAMPDAIKALSLLAEAPREQLSRLIYNLTSFSLSAEQIAARVKTYFPRAEITYAPTLGRQKIVDSWPADMDDTAARRDWGWSPDYDVTRAFGEYLVPTIKKRYE